MMAEVMAIIGGLAAGIQLVSTTAKALLATVKLIRDLKEIPERLTLLLYEMEESISRLYQSCNMGSTLFQDLDLPRLDRLSTSVLALDAALRKVHNVLRPLVCDSKRKGRSLRILWRSVVMIQIEKELAEKLERLNRLNLEMIRELGLLGLEVQLTTKELIMANKAASSEASANLEAKLDSLRNYVGNLFMIDNMHAMTPNRPGDRSVALDELGMSSKWRTINGSPETSCSGEQNSLRISAPTACSQGPVEEVRTSQERTEQMRHYLTEGSGIGSTATLMPASQLPYANLECILFSIRTFFTAGNFDASSTITKTKYWTNTDLAIYLMKISAGATRGSSKGQIRGVQLLKTLTADAANEALDQSRTTILIELLSTLSPVNTTTCLYVRDSALRQLSQLTRQNLGNHPIKLVIDMLKDDKGDKYVSLRALTFIVERLRFTLGPVHELTQLATDRLCALLRRGGDYSEALRVARAGVQVICAILGPGSLQERMLLRRVEHVYMDQCDWAAALSVCFDIVGQRSEVKSPDPLYHDECAVMTMEDIAKTCECAKNVDQAVAWLKQARISASMLRGETEAVAHIQDKLFELLREKGRVEEIEVWSKALDAEAGSGQTEKTSE